MEPLFKDELIQVYSCLNLWVGVEWKWDQRWAGWNRLDFGRNRKPSRADIFRYRPIYEKGGSIPENLNEKGEERTILSQ